VCAPTETCTHSYSYYRALSRDGRRLLGMAAGKLTVWDVDPGPSVCNRRVLAGCALNWEDLHWPRGTHDYLIGRDSHALYRYDLLTGQQTLIKDLAPAIGAYNGRPAQLRQLHCSDDDDICSAHY